MDLYIKYIKERQGSELIHDESGFISYTEFPGFLFIEDLFVDKECRQHGKGKELVTRVEELAKDLSYKEIQCTACFGANNFAASVKFIENMGYKPFKEEYTLIYFRKEL